MRANGSMSPIVYPQVTLGDEVLIVKLSLLAEVKISAAGLRMQEVLRMLGAKSEDPRKISVLFELFAACVAENYIERDLKPPTTDEWLVRFQRVYPEPEALREFLGEIGKALMSAVLKRWPVLNPVQTEPAQILDTKPSEETPN